MPRRPSPPRAVARVRPLRPSPSYGAQLAAATALAVVAVVLLSALGLARAQRAPGEDGPYAGPPPLPADLAFVTPDGGLAWLPVGASGVRAIGASSGRHVFPAWSPDGRRIAAIVRYPGGARVVVVEPRAAADGDGPPDESAEPPPAETWLDLPGAPVIYLDWSDDGRSLLALVSDAESGFTLRRLDASGDEILARGAPLYWDQLPDGGLVVHVGGPTGPRLVALDAAGRTTDELEAPGLFRSPAVSPSGRWLAVAERGPGGDRRAVVRPVPGVPASGVAEPRSLDHRGLTAFAWHPRRDLLALTRPLSDGPHSFGPLGGLDVDSGRYTPWTNDNVVAFWWAPDGERLALLATPAPAPGRVADAPRPAPDALRVQRSEPLFRLGVVDPRTDQLRWLGELPLGATFLAERLPFFDQYARSHEQVSPDGRLLALGVPGASGNEAVAVVDLRSGAVREVAPGAMPAWSPVR